MHYLNAAANVGPLQLVKRSFDRLWDWSSYQLYRGWLWIGRKLRRPYELAKLVVFWSMVVMLALWILYYLSVVLYLGFYFFVLQPPKVISLSQPLNLRYPDPGTHDYIYAYHCLSPITYPQQYNWKLTLKLPESPANIAAGVFMVSLALYPPDELPTQPHEEVKDMFYRHLQGNAGNPSVELEPVGNRLRIGSRPLLVHYRPELYRWIQTLVYAIPRLASDMIGLEWFEETQTMDVNLIERFSTTRNSTFSTKQCFVVSINNPTVQIYSAKIEATVLLEGWRYWLYYWFWTALFLGSTLIFGFLLFVICTYLFIRLLLKIIKGEVQLPRFWQSEEERQMRDMKDAVAMLRREQQASKRQRGSIPPYQPRRRTFEDDERDPALPALPGSEEDRISSKRREHRFASLHTSPDQEESREVKPRSWLDQPIAAPSNESDNDRPLHQKKSETSKSVDGRALRRQTSSGDEGPLRAALRNRDTPYDEGGPIIDVTETEIEWKNRSERNDPVEELPKPSRHTSHHQHQRPSSDRPKRPHRHLERIPSSHSEASAPIAIPRADSSRSGYHDDSDDEHVPKARIGADLRPAHGMGSDRNLASLLPGVLHQDPSTSTKIASDSESDATPPARKDPELEIPGSTAEQLGVMLANFSESSSPPPLLTSEEEDLEDRGARGRTGSALGGHPLRTIVVTSHVPNKAARLLGEDPTDINAAIAREEEEPQRRGRSRSIVSGSEESVETDLDISAVPAIPHSITSPEPLLFPEQIRSSEDAGSDDDDGIGLERLLLPLPTDQTSDAHKSTESASDDELLTIPDDEAPKRRKRKKNNET